MAANVTTAPTFRVESRETVASTEGYVWTNLIQRYDISSDGERILRLQTWVPWTSFSAAAVREGGTRLIAAAAELSPTCQALAEIPECVKAYHQVLLLSGGTRRADGSTLAMSREACSLSV